jgi:hypothetical protein
MNHETPAQYIYYSNIPPEQAIKALAAAVRWKASYTENFPDDDQHLSTIASRIDEVVEDQKRMSK